MNSKMKRWIAAILTVALSMSMFAFSVFAEEADASMNDSAYSELIEETNENCDGDSYETTEGKENIENEDTVKEIDLDYKPVEEQNTDTESGPVIDLNEEIPDSESEPFEVVAAAPKKALATALLGEPAHSPQLEIPVIDGTFSESSYTVELGETLNVSVSASTENASLTRITINVDNSGIDRLSSKEIGGTRWNGTLPLDASKVPLNEPGTYTIKLFVSVDSGDPNWKEVDQATLVVTEPVFYDELDVSIADPGAIEPGDKMIIRSSVTGGSGDYSYLWNWTHPNGTELQGTNKNCSIQMVVEGTYTFSLKVTDNVTRETCQSKKLTVEVSTPEEEYDPMKITFVGGNEDIEVEQAMLGIGAECEVSGGTGRFEYGWSISLNSVVIQNYSSGMIDEVCTWKADKVGTYTFKVTVLDLGTNLKASASQSINVIQNEYDPLTLEITDAPVYADIGEEVTVSAETSGGVGTVSTSWEAYLGSTCVAKGSGLKASFTPDAEGKYVVIMYAEDEAQELEDRVTVTVGSLAKCDLTVTTNQVKVGESVKASATVSDGIGPFKYEWMLYLDDSFVVSELDTENTSFSWTADKAGEYRIECTVYDLGREEMTGDIEWATDSATVVSEAVAAPIVNGSFEKDNYTVVAGNTLDVNVNANTENVNLTRVTINVDNSGNDRLVSKEISGTSWNGSLTLDASVAPLNVPGIYTIKLFVGVDAGDPNWREVDQATLVVTEPEKVIVIDGSFDSSSYSMEVNGMLDVAVSASAENANLTRVTINVDNSGNDRLVSKEISGTSWNGTLTLDASAAPLNVPGTYTIKLFAAVGDGSDEWAEVDQATLVVTEVAEEPEKLADPVVTVKVDGTAMTATWDAVEGAERYVYSLRNLTDDKLIAEHTATNGCTISLTLEAGKQYNLAVGAVPAGITDTIANKTLLSWDEAAFEIVAEEVPEKLAAPFVTVTVDGTTMIATWNAVDGADRYIYSLRDTSRPAEEEPLYKHVETNGCAVSLILEAGKSYKLAVASVPADVVDTESNANKCSWTEVVFKTDTAGDSMPKVLSVITNASGKVFLPGDIITATIICNKYTEGLKVSGAEGTLSELYFDEYGRNCFDYAVSFAVNGVYQINFTAVDPIGKYDQTLSGVLNVTVCDHTLGSPVLVGKSEPTPYNGSEHLVILSYEKTCLCGKVTEPYTEEALIAHDEAPATLKYKPAHEKMGHRKYYICTCGAEVLLGGANPTKDSYYSYIEALGSANKCSACHAEYEKRIAAEAERRKIKELQTLLVERGYDVGKAGIDGIFGTDTKNAMNKFRADVMGLGAIDYVDDATMQALRNGVQQPVPETPSKQETTAKPSVSPDEKQAVMYDSIDFIERSVAGKDSIYDQFFTDELRKEITVLSEGKAASSYDFIAGDAAAIISTAQADYYVDTLMKQCAGVNSDSKTISVSPEDFSLMCSFIGLDDAIINKMLEKWTVDRWTDKYGDMILDRTPALKINIKKDEFAKEMEKYEFKGLEYLGTSIEIGSYLWDCLYDYHVYSTAFDGEASTMIDSAKNRMYDSDLSAAELASMYIESCETIEGRIAYIMLKNANIADFARDEVFDAMLSNPSLKLAYEGSTLINDLLFGTTDLLEANHGTYWSMQMVDELHDELVDCIERYQNDSSEANYNDCIGTYSLYTTYLISAYNGVLESIEIYSGSLAANMIGDGLTADEKALVEQWELFMEWYADDIEYALKDNSIDAILKQLEEMN